MGLFHDRHFDKSKVGKTRVNKISYAWIPFSWFSFKILVLWMLAHCDMVMSYWDTWNEQSLLPLWVTPVLFQLWLVCCGKKRAYFDINPWETELVYQQTNIDDGDAVSNIDAYNCDWLVWGSQSSGRPQSRSWGHTSINTRRLTVSWQWSHEQSGSGVVGRVTWSCSPPQTDSFGFNLPLQGNCLIFTDWWASSTRI